MKEYKILYERVLQVAEEIGNDIILSDAIMETNRRFGLVDEFGFSNDELKDKMYHDAVLDAQYYADVIESYLRNAFKPENIERFVMQNA